MMAVVTSAASARPAPFPSQTAASPQFYSKQTFRVPLPGRVGLTLKIVSVMRREGSTLICFTVNGAAARALSPQQFCEAYPDRVQIAS